jgi:hypothetical protein
MLSDLKEQMNKFGKDSESEDEMPDKPKPIGFNRDELQHQKVVLHKGVKNRRTRKLHINNPQINNTKNSGDISSTFNSATPSTNYHIINYRKCTNYEQEKRCGDKHAI